MVDQLIDGLRHIPVAFYLLALLMFAPLLRRRTEQPQTA